MNPPTPILFPIAVEPSALLDYKDPHHKQTHVVTAKLLRDYGILSYGPNDKQVLKDAIGELSGRANQVWASTVEYLKVSHREDNQSRTSSLEEFLRAAAKLDNSAEVVRLAVVANSSAALTQKSGTGSNITEQVTLPDIDESQAVIDASGIGTFARSEPRSTIAEQLLKPLAARSTHVRIMDPHILEPLVTKNDRQGNDRSAHVEWLLGVLGAAMPPDSTISWIGTLQKGWHQSTRTDAEAHIERFLDDALQARTTPLTVQVRLVQAAKTPLQNRFLWFDCGCSFDVLHNFYPLNDDPLKQELRFSRQNEETGKQTEHLADEYERFTVPARVSITKRLCGGTSATPGPPSAAHPASAGSKPRHEPQPRQQARPRPHPPPTARSGRQ